MSVIYLTAADLAKTNFEIAPDDYDVYITTKLTFEGLLFERREGGSVTEQLLPWDEVEKCRDEVRLGR